MRPEAVWRRLWLDVTGQRIALPIALLGLAIAAFNFDPAKLGNFGFIFGAGLGGIAFLWIAFRVQRAGHRRGFLRERLAAALAANGDDVADAAADLFPDIPVCVTRKRFYCAMARDVDVQPLELLAWAYAEYFYLRFYKQLVVWNASAAANVVPIRKRYIGPALARLKAAAPWLPTGYSKAMKETWNADHQDFLALIAARREAHLPFDLPWAGTGVARVAAVPSSDMVTDREKKREDRAEKRLMAHWDEGKN